MAHARDDRHDLSPPPSQKMASKYLLAGLAPSLPKPHKLQELLVLFSKLQQDVIGLTQSWLRCQNRTHPAPPTQTSHAPTGLAVGPTWEKATLRMPQHSGDCSFTNCSWGFQAVKWILFYLMKRKKIKLAKWWQKRITWLQLFYYASHN